MWWGGWGGQEIAFLRFLSHELRILLNNNNVAFLISMSVANPAFYQLQSICINLKKKIIWFT